MSIRRRTVSFACFFLFVLFSHSTPGLASAADQVTAQVVIIHHELFVQIVPEQHLLIAKDRLTLAVPQSQAPIRLSLSSTLQIDRIALVPEAAGAEALLYDLPFELKHGSVPESPQQITIPSQVVPVGLVRLDVHYHGLINDLPRDPRHLRFVTPSETAGHIGPEGVYVSSESHWYPDVTESLSTYRLLVAVPSGWTAVTQGNAGESRVCPAELCRNDQMVLTEWVVAQPSEAVTLVANRFIATVRDWTAKTGQKIQLSTYLFPDDAHLAEEYLEATARYLDAYIPLLGSYPFEKFAVVENFFASGLGMPSFTLLGSGVIKRHYVQPYALGHEIVHSWIGNAVFNRIDRGNWVEGLTTYLANYYWHELAGGQAQARDQRRLMVQGYNLHVPPERDYPVGQFTQKQDEHDNAIGYQKSSMLFHLLRQEVGEEPFWRALKTLVVQYRGTHAEWRDLERVFAEESGQDLRWFFTQWVERDGAPTVSLSEALAYPVAGASEQTFQLETTIVQSGKSFRFPLQLLIRMEGDRKQVMTVPLRERREPISLTVPARPISVELDPDFMAFRRIARHSLPPVLNHYVTDRRRSVLTAFTDGPDHLSPFRDLVTRIEAQESQQPLDDRTVIASLAPDGLLPQEGSVLVLGGPESRSAIQAILTKYCGERVVLSDTGMTVMGAAHEGPGLALLASCHRADRLGSVVTVLYAAAPQAVAKVARLLFFYGWNSVQWPLASDRTEVRLDASNPIR
ncbi:MAG: M1 family aminopeptidase [Nitrospirae bacterium]|nr:M1 family aminopeptidase [Nitrospirota bacterium]